MFDGRRRPAAESTAALAVALFLALSVSSPVAAQEGAGADGSERVLASPHGLVVDFLFPGLPFQVLDLSTAQMMEMAEYTARLHRGYGHDLHHLYHGGGVDGLYRSLPHLRTQVRNYRRNIVEGVLTKAQRRQLAAAFDEEAFKRNRHGYRVLRLILGDDVAHDHYGIPDRHGVGTDHLGFKKGHGTESTKSHAGTPPPR